MVLLSANSVSFAAPAVMGVAALAYLLSLRRQTRAARWLAIFIALVSGGSLGWFCSFSIAHPLARFAVAGMDLYGLVPAALVAFALRLPREHNRRKVRLVTALLVGVGLFTYTGRQVQLWSSEARFEPGAMGFLNGAEPFSSLLIAYAAYCYLLALAIFIRRALRWQGHGKNPHLNFAIAVSFQVAATSAVVAFKLGLVNFEQFTLGFSVATQLAMLALAGVFLQNGPHASSILIKATGVTLAIALSVMSIAGVWAHGLAQKDQLLMTQVALARAADAIDYGIAPPRIAGLAYIRPAPAAKGLSPLVTPLPGAAMHPEYRSDARLDPRRYLAVFQISAASGRIYEGALHFADYRRRGHEHASALLILMIGSAIFIVTALPVFLRSTVARPLRKLLAGVQLVNRGERAVQIRPSTEDEIGLLTRHFNRMVQSLSAADRELRAYASELELRVDERTAELRASLNQLESVKNRMEAEYYLTSLLVSPLEARRFECSGVQIDTLVRQKMQLTYRRWQAQIGGDICLADGIQIGGRNCVVFVNADAMGKSIQGAGGALVLGAVFQALIQRTRIANTQESTPAEWLYNAYLELRKVFETFDHYMYATAFLALVDPGDHCLYCINAEHPPAVLLREGETSFLAEDQTFPRLGRAFPRPERTEASRIELQSGDVIIAGSDGRDDLALQRIDADHAIINEDRSLFAQTVAECGGDLERIQQQLAGRGEFVDDLSLIRMSFQAR